jgi:hypothetical protein
VRRDAGRHHGRETVKHVATAQLSAKAALRSHILGAGTPPQAQGVSLQATEQPIDTSTCLGYLRSSRRTWAGSVSDIEVVAGAFSSRIRCISKAAISVALAPRWRRNYPNNRTQRPKAMAAEIVQFPPRAAKGHDGLPPLESGRRGIDPFQCNPDRDRLCVK